MKRKLMLLMTFLMIGIGLVNAQVSKVTGTVTSEEDGLPVVGASVLVKGTTVGTVTDIDGNFTINNVPSSAKTLVVSFIGLETQEVAIKPNVQVTLASDSQALDEVMVVAYGTAKKSSFTGSAGTMNSDKIATRSVSNITNAMSGQVAGVQMTSNNGQPGESAKIRIRGVGSMSSSNDPLYVVDGVPYDGNISSIYPSDIESLTVLKDASANAIYGARGANGVVLITTKSGQNGEARVTFDAKWGSNSRAVPNYDVISNPGEYYETMFKALYNSKAYAGSSAADAYAYANNTLFDAKDGGLGYQVYTVPKGENLIGTNFKLNPNATLGYSDGTYYYTPDDWYDEIFGSSFRQEYNASVSGKSDKISYYASAGYLNDTGLIQNSAFKRYTGRGKVDYQAKKRLKISSNLQFNRSIRSSISQNDESRGVISNALMMDPLTPVVYDAGSALPAHVQNLIDAGHDLMTDENGNYYGISNYVTGECINPLVQRNLMQTETTNSSMIGNIALDITPFKGFVFTSRLGIRFNQYNAHVYKPGVYYNSEMNNSTPSVSDADATTTYWQWENFASYNKSINNNNYTVKIGTEVSQKK